MSPFEMEAPTGPDQPAKIPPPQSLQKRGTCPTPHPRCYRRFSIKEEFPQAPSSSPKAPYVLVPCSHRKSCASSIASPSRRVTAGPSSSGDIWRVCHGLRNHPLPKSSLGEQRHGLRKGRCAHLNCFSWLSSLTDALMQI